MPPLAFLEQEHVIQEIFSQRFYYLGSGNQCYIFASQDDKYVIKFFKMHKILPKNWLRDFPFSLFEKYRLDNVEKRQKMLEDIFKSVKVAYEEFHEESGLVYLHLNKTRDLKKKIELIGFEGEKYIVDLDGKEFIIQKKAQKFCDYLLNLKTAGDEEKMRRPTREFLELIAKRCKCGYGDMNSCMRSNIGFMNGHVVFLDCFHFFVDDSLKSPQYFQKEILSAAEKISQWAEQYYLELALILQEEAESVIDEYLRVPE
ncbi:MAG TPA: hypothetical protein VGJ00_09385 [Rhabdochlamydiaceae bacterium]